MTRTASQPYILQPYSLPLSSTDLPSYYVPRSTLTLNPFANIRRRIGARSKCKPQFQLIEELLLALDEYIASFAPALRGPLVDHDVDPFTLAPELLQDPSFPPRIVVPREQLDRITDELDTLLAEIVENDKDFQSALSQGSYGPLATVPISRYTPRSVIQQRYRSFEPATWQEIQDGQSWAVRLRRDLGIGVQGYAPLQTAGAPMGLTDIQEVAQSATVEWPENIKAMSETMQKNESQSSTKSEQLLDEGMRRWERYSAKKEAVGYPLR